MDEHSAHRTLVKSPPELWAEISELEALARHLGEFGEIRITRLEPETTVAWEGDRASGTVRLEPSGWGTKVTLTAQLPEPEPVPLKAAPEPESEPQPEREPDAEPEPLVANAPLDVVEPEPTPDQPATRKSLFARLFRRRRPQPEAEAAPAPAPEVSEPEPIATNPEPIAADPDPEPAAEPASDHPLGPADPTAILTRVLDDLGAAHHRPFSRA